MTRNDFVARLVAGWTIKSSNATVDVAAATEQAQAAAAIFERSGGVFDEGGEALRELLAAVDAIIVRNRGVPANWSLQTMERYFKAREAFG